MDMTPDELELLQKLLNKFNKELKTITSSTRNTNCNRYNKFNNFIIQLNDIIEDNKSLLNNDWYMDLFYLHKATKISKPDVIK